MSVVSRGDLIQAFVSLAVTLLLMGAVLFLSAGTLQWPHGVLFQHIESLQPQGPAPNVHPINSWVSPRHAPAPGARSAGQHARSPA